MLGLGIIGWIVIGGLAGWVASKIMGTDASMGLVKNVVAGIIGGLVGGFIMGAILGFDTEGAGFLWSFLVCLGGACLVIWGAQKIKS